MQLILLLCVVWAQSSEAEPRPDYEITVYGDGAVRQARWDTILALKRLGWEPIDKGGETRFKPPRRWMGRATLTREGNLEFGYPVVKLRRVKVVETSTSMEETPAFRRDPGSLSLVDGTTGKTTNTLPSGNAGLWLLPSRTILNAHYDRVKKSVQSELDALATVNRDTRVHTMLDRIPPRLDALWTDGVALDSTGTLPVDERPAHLLRYWSRQPDDFEGQQISRTVEAWMRNTLTKPLDPALVTEAEAGRTDGRSLLGIVPEE